ncbi:MAG: lipopolysaccharide biosynthesis protein [Balneola sp.]|nr:MAG: lipopolysaccharide biosynthesis protein [Balneola sp.]
MSSLSDKAVVGVFWAGVEKFGGKAIQFASTIVLARILTPEDYGLIASIIIVFAVAQVLIDSGFSQALIREKNITDQDRATTFYVNLIIAFLLSILIWFSAEPISVFYENDTLINLTKLMAVTPLISSLSIIQRAQFIHQINFKGHAFVYLVAFLLSSVLAIYAAVEGLGVWALAIQYVSMAFFTSLLFWIVNPWIPKGFIRKESFERLFGFGYKLMLSGLLDISFKNLYKVLIAKYFQFSILGFYSQAENIKNSISENLIGSVTRANYTTLSKVKDDQERITDAHIKTVQVTSYFVFPIMTGLILVAEPFIITLIGSKWAPSVPILQVIAIAGMINHLQVLNTDVLKIFGHSGLLLKLQIIKKTGVLIAIIIGIQYGFWGLIIGQVISSYFSLFLNMRYTAKLIIYPIADQIKDIIHVLLYSLPMIAIVFVIDGIQFELIWVRLIILILVGAGTYLGTSFILKPIFFKNMIYILRPKFKMLNRIKV